MSDDVIEAAGRFVFSMTPELGTFRFLWHAGEPLMAGLAFYRRAFSILERLAPRESRVEHSIQTNGTLITDQWCKFFRENRVEIGLSIDGPAELHDAYRRSWAGRASHRRVMQGYDVMRNNGIMPGALCVLAAQSLACPDEIYDFFADSGFHSVAFNVEEAEGVNASSSLSRSSPDRVVAAYRHFTRRIWRRWRAFNRRLVIREFNRELHSIWDRKSDSAFVREPDEVIPFGIVTVCKDGGVSTFAPELASTSSNEYQDFLLGNVLRDSPSDIYSNVAFQRLAFDVARGREACRGTCPYFALCGGGFQSNRLAEHGSLLATETVTCRVHRKALIDTVLEELLRESEEMKNLPEESELV